MLDDSTTPSSADDLPRPPAGRRAARRPAGPPEPATVPASAAHEHATAAATPEASVGSDPQTARAPRKRTARKAATGAGEADTSAPVKRAPRKRAPRKSVDSDVVALVDLPVGEAAVTDEQAVAEVPAPVVDASRLSGDNALNVPDAAVVEVHAVVTETGPDVIDPTYAADLDAPAAAVVEPAADSDRDADGVEAEDTEAEEASSGTAPADLESEIARRLPAAMADPFSPPVVRSPRETEEVLASLTEAIAADEEEPNTDAADEGDSDDDAQPRQRRRRRGGRRRRRSGDREDRGQSDGAGENQGDDAERPVAEPSQAAADADDPTPQDPEQSEAEDNDEAGEGTRRRRRRRRRRGDSTEGDDDPNVEIVSRVREPRHRNTTDEVTGIEGSTRLEAKRQRRREGRTATRRRAPILSEAEFLSRRESVNRTMVIRQKSEYTQIGVLEDNVLVEHYVDRASATSLIGNIYLGRVQNVLPSMEAAFIDIGRGRNAVLYAGEVDWDSYGADGSSRKMEQVFKSGQSVLVQVTKDPVGAKGARLTNHISLPGRYIVFSPGGELSGISRKLPDTERARLKGLLDHLIPEAASVIVRTAAEGVAEDDLVRDVNRLTAQWEAIDKKAKAGHAPQLLYAEPDATVRIVRDLFTEDFGSLVVDGNGGPEDAYDMISAYVEHVAPHLADRLQRWDRETSGDLFSKYRIDEQIDKALERKVFLPSGGSLVIDRTEAMTVIDVNTGKFTGTGGNLEATITSNNLEAAEEIVRQLRLRDIGGIVVIDFIDMVLPSNRELLLRRLVECLGRDRTRHQVSEVTSLGLVQMTRKKIGTGLAEAFTEQCDHCKGRGFTISEEPVDSQAPADGGDRHANKGRPQRNRGGRKGEKKGDKKPEGKHTGGRDGGNKDSAADKRADAPAADTAHETPAPAEGPSIS